MQKPRELYEVHRNGQTSEAMTHMIDCLWHSTPVTRLPVLFSATMQGISKAKKSLLHTNSHLPRLLQAESARNIGSKSRHRRKKWSGYPINLRGQGCLRCINLQVHMQDIFTHTPNHSQMSGHTLFPMMAALVQLREGVLNEEQKCGHLQRCVKGEDMQKAWTSTNIAQLDGV